MNIPKMVLDLRITDENETRKRLCDVQITELQTRDEVKILNMILLKQRPVVEQLKLDLVDLKNMFGWKLDQFAELDKKVKKVEPNWYTVVNHHIRECAK